MNSLNEGLNNTSPTALELYDKLPEGVGCEVIFNKLLMPPSPSIPHQLLLSDLHVLIYNFLKEHNYGKVIPAPADVYFEDQESVIQPDLLVILNDNLGKIKDNGIHGAPDIVIEILSSNRKYDTRRKKELYEKAGVKEYFMIDPENKKVTLLALNSDNVYEQTYEETGLFTSGIISCNISF